MKSGFQEIIFIYSLNFQLTKQTVKLKMKTEYREEGNDLMVEHMKLTMNSLYVQSKRKGKDGIHYKI